MRELDEQLEKRENRLWWILGASALVVITVLVVVSLVQPERHLKPPRVTATAGSVEETTGLPELMTFARLNDEADSMRDHLIRVTGHYVSLTPEDCQPMRGPRVVWGLIADDLQLDAVGFEDVVRHLAAETELTVDGIWRKYEGPVGCGKGPSPSLRWFLEVERIVQPNPLFRTMNTESTNSTASSLPSGQPTPTATAPGGTTPVQGIGATATVEPMSTTDIISVGTLTLTPVGGLTSVPTTATNGTSIPAVTQTAIGGTAVATSSLTASPTAFATPAPNATPSVTGTLSPVVTTTVAPTLPPLVTATPGDGYPGPLPTPTSSTPDPYP